MIISTRGRYALRVMIDLSQQDPDSYTPLKEIAARQEISEKYLENILKSLVTQGFILGLRGKGGGYRLTKSPEEYTLASILHATEGSLAAVACLEDHAPECARAGQCPTRPIWEKLDNLIHRPEKLIIGDKEIYGISRGIDAQGALLLEQDGVIKAWVGGEISLRSAE